MKGIAGRVLLGLALWTLILGATGSSRATLPPQPQEENFLIFFAPESADLTERALQALDMVVQRATGGGYDGAIMIGGYTDRAETTEGLAEDRAAAVRNMLAALGIEPGRLTAQGRGDQALQPGVAGELNRRVLIDLSRRCRPNC